MKCNVGTIKWNPSYSGILGAVVYIIISELLPDWKHAILGLFAAMVYLGTYQLLPKKLEVWKRAIISITVTLIVACIIRFGFY